MSSEMEKRAQNRPVGEVKLASRLWLLVQVQRCPISPPFSSQRPCPRVLIRSPNNGLNSGSHLFLCDLNYSWGTSDEAFELIAVTDAFKGIVGGDVVPHVVENRCLEMTRITLASQEQIENPTTHDG